MKTLALIPLLIGCAKSSDDTGTSANASTTESQSDNEEVLAEPGDEDGDEAESGDSSADVDNSVCSEEYSLCGSIQLPSDLTGTTRSMAIVLYSSVPPAGPPDGIIEEIANPVLEAGGSYPVRVLPALFNGDYYIWVNLYMEGGGEWAPVNGVDYEGSTAAPITFDGSPISFDDISLNLASGY